MLDESVPYYNIIMMRRSGRKIPNLTLPAGFSLAAYSPGDEEAWTALEASVGEFCNLAEARAYFQKRYLPYAEELSRRCIFIQTDQGQKVATFTIWWDYQGQLRIPSVHWVAVDPEFQGLGLGKAIVCQGMKLCLAIEGDRDVYLHTQTWSWKAVAIYLQAGFEILQEGSFADYQNDYTLAMEVLRTKLR